MIPLFSPVNQGTWNFSPTKATPTGGDFISQEEWVYLEGERQLCTIMQIPTLNYHSLLTQSYVPKPKQHILCILTLFKSFQDPAFQIPTFLQGFLHLPFMPDRLLWKIGKLDNPECLFKGLPIPSLPKEV